MEITIILVVSTILVTATVFLSLLILFDAPRERAQTGGRLMSEGILFHSFSFIFVLGVIGAISSNFLRGMSHVSLVVAVFSFPVVVQMGLGIYLTMTGYVPGLHLRPFSKSFPRTLLVSFEVALILMGISILIWRFIYYFYTGF